MAQVATATLLVAGCPVGVVWWLRASGTVSSPVVAVILGMALSLCASIAGCVVWEKRTGSEDLLFSELMIWGFLRRLRNQRRLASALDMVAPLGSAEPRALDGLSTNEQAKLLEQLAAGMETRDPYLHGHSRRVARHSWMIAKRMGLPAAEVARIRTAAAIHDVGKVETPKAILHKAGPLTDEEYDVIKRHPGDGAQMAAVLRDAELTSMVRHHHERLDGTGYPDGLVGEEIPLGARIIAVADTFDAVTSARPYRSASPHKRAMDILKEEAGTRLDPAVVRAFCGHYAGREPLALWSFVAGLPDRLVSWFGASAATVASAAKMAAVAALVGGALATSATLALPAVRPRTMSARMAPTAGLRAHAVEPTAGRAPATAAAAARPAAGPSARHAGPRPSVHRGSASGGATTAQPTALASVGGGSGQGTAPGAGEAVTESTQQSASTEKGEEGVRKGKREEVQGKKEEAASARKSEEAHGKSEEAHARKEEASSAGNSEEAHGKSEGAKKEEASSAGNSEEAHGKSEEAHAEEGRSFERWQERRSARQERSKGQGSHRDLRRRCFHERQPRILKATAQPERRTRRNPEARTCVRETLSVP